MKERFVPYEKMSKAQRRAYNRQARNTNGFNTGTRVHSTMKGYYDRKEMKAEMREIMRGI